MANLPSGTVTFLFTDIEGSTALWELDYQKMAAAVARHLELLDGTITAHHGVHFKTVGDAVQAAFCTAPDAVAAALDAQRALTDEDWGEVGPLRVRIALHTGSAQPDAHGDYLAGPLNRLSRVLAAGHGGQILLSQAVQQLARDQLPQNASLLDLGEHRLRDLLEPERLYQLLHPDLPDDFPRLTTLEQQPHNLPVQPTPLIGRDHERGKVAETLRHGEVRLVTLTGPGGVGKTRLAVQVAADLLDDFTDGVWFVDLAPLSDPTFVPSAIATSLGVKQAASGKAQIQALGAFLREKRMLLLLDNFEHLLEGAATVAELLARAPGLKILVTSRAPLQLRGEREVSVPPLRVTDDTFSRQPDQSLPAEAVQLFIARATDANPGFALTAANRSAVEEICRRLDGLPLAIELAAARIKLLPPAALVQRLERRLPLLTGGARDAPARQRTLRDAIAWSYDLLGECEQALFRRLAVFAGGCSIESAEAIANPEETMDVFTGLSALLDVSLLRQTTQTEGEPRFVMLETIREYALEQLVAAGEESSTRSAHAAYFLAPLVAAAPTSPETNRTILRQRLMAERDNLRAALAWVAEHGALGVDCTPGDNSEHLFTFYRSAGEIACDVYANQEAVALFQRALAVSAEHPALLREDRDRVAAQLHEGIADLLELTGQHHAAMDAYASANDALEEGDLLWRARLDRKLGDVLRLLSRYDEAEQAFARAEAHLRIAPHELDQAAWQEWVQIQLGRMYMHYFHADTARLAQVLDTMRPVVERDGTPLQRALYYQFLTLLSFLEERYTGSAETVRRAREALAATEAAENDALIAQARFLVGFTLWHGRADDAETHLRAALTLAERIGDLTMQARCLVYLAVIARQRGDAESTRLINDRVLAIASTGQMQEYVAAATANLAWLAWRERNWAVTEEHARRALDAWRPLPNAYPFRWLALWPLLGVLLIDRQIPAAVEVAQAMLHPQQQAFEPALSAAIEEAVSAPDEQTAGTRLQHALKLATSLGYL